MVDKGLNRNYYTTTMQETVKKLNDSFSMKRENHNPEDFKTIEDFKMEYGDMEVDDLIESLI